MSSSRKHQVAKIITYFSKINWKSTLTFLWFLIIACAFWMLLFFQRDLESTYKLPIKYTKIPDDIIFDNTLPKDLEIRIGDKGSEIFKYAFLLRDSIIIDINKYHEEGVTNIQGGELTQLIRSKLSKSSTIVAYYPVSINITTSKLQKKEVDVIFEGEISTGRTNLVVDEIQISPEKIIAYGSEKQLSDLVHATTVFSQFNNIKATSQFDVKIGEMDGIKFVPDIVQVYIPILEFTERKIEVPITVKGAPKNVDVKFFPSQTEVSFSVTLEDYKKITPEEFVIELDYDEFYNNANGRVELNLTTNPASIRNVKISPSSVEFLLEKR